MKFFSYIVFFLIPLVSQARGLRDMIVDASSLLQGFVVLAFALALMAFFYGMAGFILHSGSDTAKEEGKRIMIWGVIALFVIASLWGIIAWIQGDLTLSGWIDTVDALPRSQTR